MGCFASCFGQSDEQYTTHRRNYDTFQPRNKHSSHFANQRSWANAERPPSTSSSGIHRGVDTTIQQTRQGNYFTNDKQHVFPSSSISSRKCEATRTLQRSSRGGKTNRAVLANRQSKSTTACHSKVSHHAFPYCQVEPKQVHQVKPQTVKSPQTRVKYHLKEFTCQLQARVKDATFAPGSNFYQNQWTVCQAVIIDQFGMPMSNSTHIAELSSVSSVKFCNVKTNDSRLQFMMKPRTTGNISVSIKIYNSAFIKTFCVKSCPCSNTLSEMVLKSIESFNSHEDQCVYRIAIVDVFGEPVPSDSLAICELKSVLPFEYSVEGICTYSELGKKYFDVTLKGEKPWKNDLLLLNGKLISAATKFEFSSEERGKIKALLDKSDHMLLQEGQISIHDFIDCDGPRIFIPLQTGNHGGEFVPYDKHNCQMQRLSGGNGCKLVCRNTKKYDVTGADFAHINNIKRALQLKDRVDVHEFGDEATVIIDLNDVQTHHHPICKELVQHLLAGLYYRKKASEAARIRMRWKEILMILAKSLSVSLERSPSLKLCKFFKGYFGQLMNRYNRAAANELFDFFNFQRDKSEVDLHGLFVADEKRLELQRLDMLRGSLDDDQIDAVFERCKIKSFKGLKKQALKKELMKGEMSEDEIKDFIERCQHYIRDKSLLEDFQQDLLERRARKNNVLAIIDEWRSESDEAIRFLKPKLDNFDHEEAIANNTPWLEIIVGAGHHSRVKNEQNIRPKVEKLLKERKLEFTPVNKGSLVVTFQSYSGPEPCFGEYYCEKCDRCWKSSKSYIGKYQKCVQCKSDCWPVKQRGKEKVVNYHRDGAESIAKRKSGRHQSSLCQKCTELGHPCNEDDYYDSDYYDTDYYDSDSGTD